MNLLNDILSVVFVCHFWFLAFVDSQSTAEVSATPTQPNLVVSSLPSENVKNSLTVEPSFLPVTLTSQELSSLAFINQLSSVNTIAKTPNVVLSTNQVANTHIDATSQLQENTNPEMISASASQASITLVKTQPLLVSSFTGTASTGVSLTSIALTETPKLVVSSFKEMASEKLLNTGKAAVVSSSAIIAVNSSELGKNATAFVKTTVKTASIHSSVSDFASGTAFSMVLQTLHATPSLVSEQVAQFSSTQATLIDELQVSKDVVSDALLQQTSATNPSPQLTSEQTSTAVKSTEMEKEPSSAVVESSMSLRESSLQTNAVKGTFPPKSMSLGLETEVFTASMDKKSDTYFLTSNYEFGSSVVDNILTTVETEAKTVTPESLMSSLAIDTAGFVMTGVSTTTVNPNIKPSPSFIQSMFLKTTESFSVTPFSIIPSVDISLTISASSSSIIAPKSVLYSSLAFSDSFSNIKHPNRTDWSPTLVAVSSVKSIADTESDIVPVTSTSFPDLVKINISQTIDSYILTSDNVYISQTESITKTTEILPPQTILASFTESFVDDVLSSSIEHTLQATNISISSTEDLRSSNPELTSMPISGSFTEMSVSSINVTELINTIFKTTTVMTSFSDITPDSASIAHNRTGEVDQSTLNFTDIPMSITPTMNVSSVMQTDDILVMVTTSPFESLLSDDIVPSSPVNYSLISPEYTSSSLGMTIDSSINETELISRTSFLAFNSSMMTAFTQTVNSSIFESEYATSSTEIVDATVANSVPDSITVAFVASPSINITNITPTSASSVFVSELLPMTSNNFSIINISDVTVTQLDTSLLLSEPYTVSETFIERTEMFSSGMLKSYSEHIASMISSGNNVSSMYMELLTSSVSESSIFIEPPFSAVLSSHLQKETSLVMEKTSIFLASSVEMTSENIAMTSHYYDSGHSSLKASEVSTSQSLVINSTATSASASVGVAMTYVTDTTLSDSLSISPTTSTEHHILSLSSAVNESVTTSPDVHIVNQTVSIAASFVDFTTTISDSSVQMTTFVMSENTSHIILQTSGNTSISDSYSVTLSTINMTMPMATESVNASATPNVTYTINVTSAMIETVSMSATATVLVNETDANVTDSNVTESTTMIETTTQTTTEPETTTTTEPETTTTTEPTTTAPDFVAMYWMKTVIKVPTKENVSTSEFQNKIETRLVQVYDTAVQREAAIAAGTYVERKRRKKRYAESGNVAINMQDIERKENATEVTLVYTLENNGTNVTVSEAVKTFNVISDQEMAITLQYVVTTRAAPFVEQPTVPTTVTTTQGEIFPTQIVTQESSKLWIIGVVVGVVALIIVGVWVALCIVSKSKTKREAEDKPLEPKLTNLKSPIMDQEGSQEFKYSRKGSQDMAEKGSSSGLKIQSPKKQSYDVNPDQASLEEEKHLYAEVKKPKRPESGSHKSLRSSQSDVRSGLLNDSYTNISEDAELIESPKKHKKGDKGKRKKKHKDNDQFDDVGEEPPPALEDEIIVKTVHSTSLPESLLLTTASQHFQDYYSAEEEDQVKRTKEAERKKNKQRIREKKKKEKKNIDTDGDDLMKEYLAAQEEIDEVLEAPKGDNHLPDVFIHKQKSPERKSQNIGETNEAFSAEDTLNEARSRMHKLLDDAFSLISPSSSSLMAQAEDEGFHSPRTQSPKSHIRLLNQRNKVSPADPETSSLGDQNEDDEEVREEKKHTPMIISSRKPSDKLATWSPYRASDEVALISMPTKLQTTLGKTDNSKRGKRPAAVLTEKPRKPRSNEKYTTDPPKPIVLRTRDLMASREQADPVDERRQTSKQKVVPNGIKSGIGGQDLAQRRANVLSGVDAKKSLNSASQVNEKNNRKISPHSAIEMTDINNDSKKERIKRHKEPFSRTPSGEDETDIVVKNVSSRDTPEATLQSIRDELRGIVNIRPPSSRRGGYGQNNGSLADIA